MTLAHLVYRIASDPSFAAQFAEEPHTTLLTHGITLDDSATSAALVVLGDPERTRTLCSLSPGTGTGSWYSPERGK